MDYQGNSKKAKEGLADESSPKPEKKIEKVVTTTVIVQKKSLGRKFKDVIAAADIKGVTHYLIYELFIPASRNFVVDAASKGVERLMYPGGSQNRYRYGPGPGPRYNYNNPIQSRPYSPPVLGSRQAPPPQPGPRSRQSQPMDELVLGSRREAELVLEQMNDIIDQYEVASVADLNALLGLTGSHTDNKWGWIFVGDAAIRQTRNGYLIDFPPPEPIS